MPPVFPRASGRKLSRAACPDRCRGRAAFYAAALLTTAIFQGCAYPENPDDPASPYYRNESPSLLILLDTGSFAGRLVQTGPDSFLVLDSLSLPCSLAVGDDGTEYGYPPSVTVRLYRDNSIFTELRDVFAAELPIRRAGAFALWAEAADNEGEKVSRRLAFLYPAVAEVHVDTVSIFVSPYYYCQASFRATIRFNQGEILSYFWEFGDGSRLDWDKGKGMRDYERNLMPSHFYVTKGAVKAGLTVLGTEGVWFKDTMDLNIDF